MKKRSVTILPEQIKVSCEAGSLLLDVLTEAGVVLRTPCGGRGVCGKCVVEVRGGASEMTMSETDILGGDPEKRLACQAYITGDLQVVTQSPGRLLSFDISELKTDLAYGLAVDIGSTSIQISLVDLPSGQSRVVDSFLNPQRRFGHDVIARIAASVDEEVYGKMVRLLRWRIGRAVLDFLSNAGIVPKQVERVVFSGNTVMMYFLSGLDVKALGVYPYTSDIRDFESFSGQIFGWPVELSPELFALPAASSFLGSDLVGGLAIADKRGFCRNTFFLDIGTNGEMFLRTPTDQILGTSCAMGPAMEGMNITSGMTADIGAVNHVWEEKGRVAFNVIGDASPSGICGTGLIDLIALMADAGIVLPSGKFSGSAQELSESLGLSFYNGAVQTVFLAEKAGVSQKDIRSVQLAKSATLAAATILLQDTGCAKEDIEYVIIAGALGENLSAASFRRLSFLPEFPNAKYIFAGNTSLAAAEAACSDWSFYKRSRCLRDRTRVLDLSTHPRFFELFMKSFSF